MFTTTPPTPPPVVICRTCDCPLRYEKTVLSGAETPERWDYFTCPTCKVTFEYRHRTRKLTRSVLP